MRLHRCSCSTCLLRAQVAHHLEAPIQPWARAFWPMAVDDDEGTQLRPSVAALFAAASPDVVEALCDAHPALDPATRPPCTLLKLLALLPPVADAAACRAALAAASASCDASNSPFCSTIDDSAPELCVRAVSQLRELDVREAALEFSGYKVANQTAILRAAEPLLAQQTAPGGMQVPQITLSSTLLNTPRAEILVAALPRCKAGLRSLRVHGQDVMLRGTAIEAMATLHSLEQLVLPHFNPSHLPGEAVLATLPTLPRLQSLGIRIGHSATFWTGCIARMIALQALDVHLMLDGLKAHQLGDAIARLRALTRLSLSGRLDFAPDSDNSDDEEPTYQSSQPAPQAVLFRAPKVQHLDLSDLTIYGEEDCPSGVARNLCAAVAGAALPALTRLDLCASNVTLSWPEMQPICAHLAALTRLCELNLSRNPIKDSGAARLVPCVAELTSLQNLGLSRCDIGPAGVAALTPALRQLAHLTRLDFSHNRDVSAECAGQLARELGMRAAGGVLRSLKRLRIER